MFYSRVLALSVLVGIVFGHAAKPDPSCFQLKTSKRADDCCKTPQDMTDEAVVEKCAQQLMASNMTNLLNDDDLAYKCIVNCTIKELGLMKNNALDKDATKQYFMKSMASDAAFAPVLDKAFDECFKRLAAIPPHEQQSSECGFAPYFILNCVETNLFKNCPAEKWAGGDDCTELKGKLNNGCPFYAILKDDD